MPARSSLAPSLLLSMPQLHDPNFARSVVLLCQHSSEGAFGLVINRPVVTVARVLTAHQQESAEHELEVWIGGPVEPERSWILVGHEEADEEAIEVCDGVFLTTSASVLQRIIDHVADARSRLIAGYAGWGPGQLDTEIASSAWLTVDVQPDIVFDTPADHMWETAIRRLGATPGGLQTGQGVH
jgi:putative transcriptional regulator